LIGCNSGAILEQEPPVLDDTIVEGWVKDAISGELLDSLKLEFIGGISGEVIFDTTLMQTDSLSFSFGPPYFAETIFGCRIRHPLYDQYDTTASFPIDLGQRHQIKINLSPSVFVDFRPDTSLIKYSDTLLLKCNEELYADYVNAMKYEEGHNFMFYDCCGRTTERINYADTLWIEEVLKTSGDSILLAQYQFLPQPFDTIVIESRLKAELSE